MVKRACTGKHASTAIFLMSGGIFIFRELRKK